MPRPAIVTLYCHAIHQHPRGKEIHLRPLAPVPEDGGGQRTSDGTVVIFTTHPHVADAFVVGENTLITFQKAIP